MKTGRIVTLLSATLLLGACNMDTTSGTTEGAPSAPAGKTLKEVPEGLAELAAPNQDLTTVRISDADGCYWFRWVGPVETTYLPLRSKQGRPICSQAQWAENKETAAPT